MTKKYINKELVLHIIGMVILVFLPVTTVVSLTAVMLSQVMRN